MLRPQRLSSRFRRARRVHGQPAARGFLYGRPNRVFGPQRFACQPCRTAPRQTVQPNGRGTGPLRRHCKCRLNSTRTSRETILFIIGQGANTDEARSLAARFRDFDEVEQALTATQQWWDKTLDVIQVDTPELSVNFLLNRWLLYQDLSCRIWGRSAFYQSGGAFGFRDQLQDIMAVLYSHPDFARAQILRSASRQFVEGDVQHWWHPPVGAGVRTRISDDLLWLPFVTAQYIRVTGDAGILDGNRSVFGRQAPGTQRA